MYRWILIAAVVASATAAVYADTARPNILFILTDDQRFDTIAALGNDEIRTPHMDRLARGGVAFTNAYIMGSTRPAVCMPSRAMLMTGRSLYRLANDGGIIPPDQPTLPERLRRNGYATFGTGKWHNGPDSFARSFTGGGAIFFGGMSDHLKVPVQDFDPTGEYPRDKRHVTDTFSSELFSDAAIGFLREYDGDKPFFLYVAYTAPHDPRMAPAQYAEMYKPSAITLPKNFLPRHPFDNGELRIRDELLAPFPRTPEVVREHIAAYYAMITHLDHHIGRVLKALEETGHADDTIIVFTSDNGLAVGRHGLMGKQNLYEHSIKVPLVITGPGIPEGERTDAPCYLFDLYPTLCRIADVSLEGDQEGIDLTPALRREPFKGRDTLFFAYKDVQRAVRAGDFKLIRYTVGGRTHVQLFNLKKDPWELHNLAADPGFASAQERLMRQLATDFPGPDDRRP